MTLSWNEYGRRDTHRGHATIFERPPVNEVALSAQFNPIAGLDPYLAVYWATHRASFEAIQMLDYFSRLPRHSGIVCPALATSN